MSRERKQDSSFSIYKYKTLQMLNHFLLDMCESIFLEPNNPFGDKHIKGIPFDFCKDAENNLNF